MKTLYIISLSICLYACQNKTDKIVVDKTIPATWVQKFETNTKNDVMYANDMPYSGFMYELHPETTDTLLIAGYYNGLKEGVAKKWYVGNQLMEIRYFESGHKNGIQIAFWENGFKRFEYIAKNDAYEGELKEWNSDGFLFHLANYKNGQEEGAQKLWYDNGKIRANYVIVDGKRYGLLGTKNCVNVSDSIFITQ